MKPLLKTRTTIPSLIIVFTFCCLMPSPIAQAVSPAPDGGYPGGNTAEGQNALLSPTTGQYNTAVGFSPSRPIRPAASTPPLAPGHSSPTPHLGIRLPELVRF
jgi:hypothetical protein